MVCIKVLVVVLCACSVQDALAILKVADPATGPKQQPEAAQRQTAGKQAAPKQAADPKKQTAATKWRAAPPPPKYPALTKLEDMFWDTAERVNEAGTSGKLNVRAARNAVAGTLTSPAFWTAATELAGKLAKTTHDARRAGSRVRMCDAATSALTRPTAVQDYERVADRTYGAAAALDLTPYMDRMREAVDAVDEDKVARALDRVGRAVEAVRVDPTGVVKVFNLVKRYMGNTSLATVNESVTNSITKLSVMLNRDNNGGVVKQGPGRNARARAVV